MNNEASSTNVKEISSSEDNKLTTVDTEEGKIITQTVEEENNIAQDVQEDETIQQESEDDDTSILEDEDEDAVVSEDEMPLSNNFFVGPNELMKEQLSGIFPSKMTLKAIKEHKKDIFKTMINSSKKRVADSCLKRHHIPPELRAKMVDWMIEVMFSLNCSEITFFKAVTIMDLYYSKTKRYT